MGSIEIQARIALKQRNFRTRTNEPGTVQIPAMPSVSKAPSISEEAHQHKEMDVTEDIYALVGRNVKFSVPSTAIIGEARASLRRPTRPYTPAHELRSRNLIAKESPDALFGASSGPDHKPYRCKMEATPKKKIPRRLAPLKAQISSDPAQNTVLPTPPPSAKPVHHARSEPSSRLLRSNHPAGVSLKSWERRAVDIIEKRRSSESLVGSHPVSHPNEPFGSLSLDMDDCRKMLESESQMQALDERMEWTVSGWDSKVTLVSETDGITTVSGDFPFRDELLGISATSEASEDIQRTATTPDKFPPEYLRQIEPPLDDDPLWLKLLESINKLKVPSLMLGEGINESSSERNQNSIRELFSSASTILEDMQWLRSSSESRLSRDKYRRDYVVRFLVSNLETPVKPDQAISVCVVLLRVATEDLVLLRCCKILFNLSQVEENDVHLRSHKAIDAISSLIKRMFRSAVKSKERDKMVAVIYAVGTMKNILVGHPPDTSSLQHGRLLASMIKTILEGNCESNASLTMTQLLIQITGALRNLCALDQEKSSMKMWMAFEDGRESYLGSLISLLNDDAGFTGSWELMLNVSRILSLLSTDAECVRNIANSPGVFHSLHQLAINFQNSRPLLVRIFFILGNLTVDQSLLDKLDGGGKNWAMAIMEDVVALFGIYSKAESEVIKDIAISDVGNRQAAHDDWGETRENEELVVKLIRFIANLSTISDVGNAMINMIELEMLVDILAANDINEHEELVLNVVGALANLSYYCRSGSSDEGWFLARGSDLVKLLIPLLLCENIEAVLAASRVFANISHHNSITNRLVAHRGVEVFTILVDHSCRDIVYQVCGVLMNLFASTAFSAHQTIAEAVKMEDGMNKLVDVIENGVAECDWDIVSLGCRTTHNLIRIIPSGQEGEIASAYKRLIFVIDEVLRVSATSLHSEPGIFRESNSYADVQAVARRLREKLNV
ncbi:armadillo-type protein [Cladochytrium replicatum]|nr:armadillo-type protein [Cladochytrium replicatum]